MASFALLPKVSIGGQCEPSEAIIEQQKTLIRQGTVLLMPAKKKQADYREIDESLSEFEWARRVSKTWDMGQD